MFASKVGRKPPGKRSIRTALLARSILTPRRMGEISRNGKTGERSVMVLQGVAMAKEASC